MLSDTSLVMMNDAEPENIVEIPIENIRAFRYGVNWISGRYFVIGRQYFIEIKDEGDYIIPIKFSSYYGIRRKEYHEAYVKLIQGIWDFYFIDQAKHYLNMYNLEIAFELNGISLSKNELMWDGRSVTWAKLKISNYINYFVLHHADDHKIQKSFNFKNDWNAYLLQSLILTLKPEESKI